jgi:hypothetical protein
METAPMSMTKLAGLRATSTPRLGVDKGDTTAGLLGWEGCQELEEFLVGALLGGALVVVA